ncbi:MAG: hypothetical protein HY925_03785, partial [Elusimicrobia bacterium]|nr:hypothetical protein [Elusimicrobiota bacterium]
KGAPKLKEAEPLWKSVIAAHTTGVVSRKSKVFLRFQSDVFPPDQDGKPAKGVLSVSPSIDGDAIVSGAREVVIVPKSDLKANAFYVARVKGAALPDLPRKAGDYEFSFQVMPRDYTVAVDGLVRGAGDDDWQVGGTVTTSDADEPGAVENLLTAVFEGEKAAVRWTHPAGTNAPGFLVSGLKKADKARALTLRWDGKAIDSSRAESRDVELIASGVFKVVDVRAVQGDDQHAAVYFSDQLRPEQDLKGLVNLEPGPFTVRVEGSVLKLFPQSHVVGAATLTLEAALKNAGGRALGRRESRTLAFPGQKPQLRFAGQGAILPGDEILSIPFETLNLNSVQVTAFRIYGKNVGQFLQTNTFEGEQELDRVGRYLWRKTIVLPKGPVDQWQRHFFDAGELSKQDPGGLFRLTISAGRKDSAYACGEKAGPPPGLEPPPVSREDLKTDEYSSWQWAEGELNEDGSKWVDRDDPCKDAYFNRKDSGIRASRNFLASNIGLLAKKDRSGKLHLVATDIRTAKPSAGVRITAFNFQNQAIGSADSDARGFAELTPSGKPFYLAAQKGGDRGYLKVSDGAALPVAHFDVGGEEIKDGIKGFVHGERGVWRPGDEVNLIFMLEDKGGTVADGHPATLRLYDPKGALVETIVNNKPVGDFYRFTFKTREDAPTGVWTAKVQLGGSEFSKDVRVETVMPNRLKMALDVGGEAPYRSAEGASAHLSAQWLHGAKAAGLKADVGLQLTAVPTKFSRSTDHVFDDPTRELHSGQRSIFEGPLDAAGRADFMVPAETEQPSPGALSAQFTTRVFEPSGAFSISRESKLLHPYGRYVGLKLPKGDQTRNMLLTDRKHKVAIATLDAHGEPVSVWRVKVALYQVGWKWWWEKSGGGLPNFENGEDVAVIQEGTIATRDGRGTWEFEVKYPAWGRYLVRACDEESGHCSGQVVYIDWPGWAGRAQEQSGPAASMLMAQPDKNEY